MELQSTNASPVAAAPRPAEAPDFLDTAPVRIPVLLALFATAAIYEARHLNCLLEPDVWWHLRSGAWMLQHHAMPRSGLFSQYSNRPWMAYSWGYEVLIATLYKFLGLRAIPVYLMTMKAAIAVMAFKLARGSRIDFWPAVMLATAAQYAIPDLQPRPGLFSILLFGIELTLLFQCRRTGDVKPLYWLPLLFVFWSKLHIQFVYGLLVLGLFFSVALIEDLCQRSGITWFEGHVKSLPVVTVAAVTGACLFAPLLSPYSFRLYQIAWGYAQSTVAYTYISEAFAMSFRRPQHHVLLLLAMAAFFSVGRYSRRDIFKLGLIAACSMMAFRAQRETWVVVLPSIALLADGLFAPEARQVAVNSRHPSADSRWELLLTAALVVLALVMAASRIPGSREALLAKAAEAYPVRACDFIHQNHLPAPLFSTFSWGGFIIWYLPEYPVSIDGRTDLYGDEIAIRQFKVATGELPPWSEPTFANARTLLLERHSAMAEALVQVPKFKEVYQDEQAVILLQEQ